MTKRVFFVLFVVLYGMCLHAQQEELTEGVRISVVDVQDARVQQELITDSLSTKHINYYVDYRDDKNNFAILRQGKDYYSYAYALFNTKTETLITPFVFKSVNTYDKEEDRYLVQLKQNLGVVNSKGKFIIPCIYSNLNRLKIGNSLFYIARLFDKCGVLDANNSVIIPFEYDKIHMDSETFLVLKKGNQVEITDFISKKVYLSGYEDATFMYRYNAEEQLVSVKKDGLSNVVDMKGVPKLKEWHESVSRDYSYFIVSDNGNYGLYDKDGKMVLPQQYDRVDIGGRRDDVVDITVRKNGLVGIADGTGKFIIPLEYSQLEAVTRDSIYIAKKKEKYGFLSFSNQIIVPFEYKEIAYDEGFYRINKGGKYGLMDKKGKILIPVKYDNLLRMSFSNADNNIRSTPLYLAFLNGKEGAINSSGEIVIPFEYHFQKEESYGTRARLSYPLICEKGGKYGVIDLENKIITPFQYDILSQPNPFVFVAGKNGKYGVKKVYSEELILPYEYDFIISNQENGNVTAYKNGQFEEYNLVGEKLYKK